MYSRSNSLNITAIRLDQGGCGYYRVTWPLYTLTERGHNVRIIQTAFNKRMSSHDLVCDVLIIQRQNDPVIYDIVDSIPESIRPVTVYEIDDLNWKLPTSMGASPALAKDLLRTVPPMMERADFVIASTPELAEECRRYNDRVSTVLNSIDFHIRDWTAVHPPVDKIRGRKVIGWSGSGWHGGDLEVMGSALRDVLLAHPGWCFVTQGDEPEIRKWLPRLKLPRQQVVILPWMNIDEHPSIYSLFDIGIAPLQSSEYNRCKSELKLMELGAAGVPYVASRVTPYSRFHRLSIGCGGFLASDKIDWASSLETLIRYPEVRKSMSGNGLDFTLENYSMQSRADEWEGVLNECRNSRQGFRPSVPGVPKEIGAVVCTSS